RDHSLRCALVDVTPADSRTNETSRPLGHFRPNGECRLLHGKIGGGDGVVDEVIHLLEVLFVEPLQWIEITNLAGNACGELGRVETRDVVDSATPLAQSLPRFFRSCPQRS